jgi:hypothetical protein
MNTASNPGPHTNTNRETSPSEGFLVCYKSRYTTGDSADFVHSLYIVGLGPVADRARVLVDGVNNHIAHAAARGAARCAPQVLNRSAQAYARGAAQVFVRGAQADARGAAFLFAAGTWPWCLGHCPQRRSLRVAGT